MSTPAGESPFGAGRLFLTDARLAYLFANDFRHRALHRAFGVSRADANLLTAVFALGAGAAAHDTAHKVMHPHFTLDRTNAATSAFLFHEALGGFVGPAARKVPTFASLLAFAIVGGAALPGLRRAAHAARVEEHRLRAARIRRYMAATRAEAAARAAAVAQSRSSPPSMAG